MYVFVMFSEDNWIENRLGTAAGLNSALDFDGCKKKALKNWNAKFTLKIAHKS